MYEYRYYQMLSKCLLLDYRTNKEIEFEQGERYLFRKDNWDGPGWPEVYVTDLHEWMDFALQNGGLNSDGEKVADFIPESMCTKVEKEYLEMFRKQDKLDDLQKPEENRKIISRIGVKAEDLNEKLTNWEMSDIFTISDGIETLFNNKGYDVSAIKIVKFVMDVIGTERE